MSRTAKVSAPIHPLYFLDPLMSMLNSLCPVRNASKLWPDKIYLGKKTQQNVVGPATVPSALAGPQIIINFLSFSSVMLSRFLSALDCQRYDPESHF